MEQILKAIFIIFCVNLIAILGQNPGDGAQYELEIVKLELHSGEEYLKFKGIRAKRYNRTVFGIFGDVEITVAFDEKWEVEVNVYRSKLGNNQWDLTPMKVTRRSACDFVDSIYKPKIQPDVKDISNFPIFGDDDNCPFPKGKYHVENYLSDVRHFPTHLQDGTYKIETLLFKGGEPMTGYLLYMKVEPKPGL